MICSGARCGDKKMNTLEASNQTLEASNQIGEEKEIILMQCGISQSH